MYVKMTMNRSKDAAAVAENLLNLMQCCQIFRIVVNFSSSFELLEIAPAHDDNNNDIAGMFLKEWRK